MIEGVEELRFARTEDGWCIALHRYRQSGGLAPQASAFPVMLCPGIACNSSFFDAGLGFGLGPYLARQGRDVWVIDPRGRGLSKRKAEGRRAAWHFDDYVVYDMPAALRLVLEVTGSSGVDWIGHSLGGMKAYAYAIRDLRPRLRRLVTVGSPTFRENTFWGWRAADAVGAFLTLMPRYALSRWAPAFAPAIESLHPLIPAQVYNPRNMDARVAAYLFSHVLDDISGVEVRQGLRFIRGQGFRSTSGPLKYAECFSKIDIPTLVIAGSDDRLAPPEDVQRAYHGIQSQEKAYRCFGKAEGQREEYGHVDLLLGRWAEEEVFPHIADWLDR